MEDAFYVLRQVLEGLAAAHSAEIVHRDLKPDNVFVLKSRRGQRDFVKLLDFGISKFSKMGDSAFSMTSTGAVLGTPYYMSPEQARGKGVDHRTDLYSTGVILYECVTGSIPFRAETFNELMFKIGLEEPPPVRSLNQDVDEEFAAVIKRAMTREANDRFQSALEFQQALDEWAQHHGIAAPRSRPAPATAARPSTAQAPPTQPSAVNGLPVETGGVWSQTGGTQPTTPKPSGSSKGLLFAAAGGLALLLGIGATVAIVTRTKATPAASAASEPPPAVTTEAPPEKTAEPTPTPKETAAPPEPSSTAAVATTATSKTTTPKATQSPNTSKTAATSKTTTKPEVKAQPTSTSGRKIRDDI
jgi:serine/threonine-protein kinase